MLADEGTISWASPFLRIPGPAVSLDRRSQPERVFMLPQPVAAQVIRAVRHKDYLSQPISYHIKDGVATGIPSKWKG